jgi:hypothetical protein
LFEIDEEKMLLIVFSLCKNGPLLKNMNDRLNEIVSLFKSVFNAYSIEEESSGSEYISRQG